MTPSPPSTRPSGSTGRRSSAFVRERHAPIDARGRPALSGSVGCVLSDPPGASSEITHGPWHEVSNGHSNAATFSPKRQMTEETISMKAIVVTDQAAGTAGMKLVERPEPQAAINDVVVQVHASGFVGTELTWPSTWSDRRDRDRTPSIPGHELAGVVTALGYGTTGLSVGQRVFGLADWHRDGTLAEYVAIEARNLAPLPGDVDFTVGASLPISGLTAWQGLFQHGRLQAG